MKAHRNPRPSVPKPPAPDNFNPGDALELLYTELIEVEALAHAAGEAVTLLPSTSSVQVRRRFARLYSLVTRTADQAAATLTLGENLVTLLSGYMAARRAASPPAAAAPATTQELVRRAR
jgi:hypothetical protein